MRKLIVIILVFTIGLFSMKFSQPNQNLIPRTVLFGNPVKAGAKISPDGKKLSYLAPHDGVMNIWTGDLDDAMNLSNEKPITFDKGRGISTYFWAPRGNEILYIQDRDGDENWRLYSVDLSSNIAKCFTPHKNVQVRVNSVTKHHPDTIIFSMNIEEPKFHDLYKLDLKTGEIKMIEKNPGYFEGYLLDHEQNVKGAINMCKDGSVELLLKNGDKFNPFYKWNPTDAEVSGPLGFTKDCKYIYLQDATGYNAGRLVKCNLSDMKMEVILEDPNYDVAGVTIDDDTHEILWATYDKDREEKIIFDPKFKEDFEFLAKVDSGDAEIVSMNDAKDKMVVLYLKDDAAIPYYLYDRNTKTTKFLFVNRPDLAKYKLSKMEPIKYEARDGLTIHGYLTLPVDQEPKKLPLILLVHGGPQARDSWGFNTMVQWMANRGYAVLQTNYRGSSGYGKKFIEAGDREWAGKMHDDLLDAVNWAVAKGFADPNKVTVFGGSYGGYAALVGATFTPDSFCCAVDVVGPSNLVTLLKTIPPYWESGRALLYKKIGNPETEKEFVESRSPLFKVKNIKIPLMIVQGANDPRVKQSESDQIVAALKEHDIDHDYMLFHDEGHGLVKPENKLKFYAAAEKFLAKHLGGRVES